MKKKLNGFKVIKLFLYVISNLFNYILNNFKIHKFLINFNYICSNPYFLHASLLNDETRFLFSEKYDFLKKLGVATYFSFIFKGKIK